MIPSANFIYWPSWDWWCENGKVLIDKWSVYSSTYKYPESKVEPFNDLEYVECKQDECDEKSSECHEAVPVISSARGENTNEPQNTEQLK